MLILWNLCWPISHPGLGILETVGFIQTPFLSTIALKPPYQTYFNNIEQN